MYNKDSDMISTEPQRISCIEISHQLSGEKTASDLMHRNHVLTAYKKRKAMVTINHSLSVIHPSLTEKIVGTGTSIHTQVYPLRDVRPIRRDV